MPEDKPNIYPPEIFDPLLPGGIPSPTGGATNAIEKCQRLAAELGNLVDKLPDPDPEAVKRDRYLGEFAKDYNPDEDPQR